MHRRRLLALSAAPLAFLAGCSTASGPTPDPGTAVQVTTSTADAIVFHVSQIAIPAEATGPNAYHRLENTGDRETTVRIETVLRVTDGGTYRSFAVVTVPAGEEVTVSYRIVAFEELTETEATNVRRGDVEVTTLVNGEALSDR